MSWPGGTRRRRQDIPSPKPSPSFATVYEGGPSVWRGRSLNWSPDRETDDQRRQRWIIETKTNTNLVERDYPDQYVAHRDAYMETGDINQLRMMLEYVR